MIVCIFFPPKMQACKLQTKAWLQSRDDVVVEYIEMFLSAYAEMWLFSLLFICN